MVVAHISVPSPPPTTCNCLQINILSLKEVETEKCNFPSVDVLILDCTGEKY